MSRIGGLRSGWDAIYLTGADCSVGHEKEVLPTFLIGGAPKAGTTSLYRYCKEHPNICMSRPKETGFFHKKYDRGVEWFKSHFNHWNGEQAIGEASVMTMSVPRAAHRIANHIPDAQLIFILRDPVERMISDYYYNVRNGWIEPTRPLMEYALSSDKSFEDKVVSRGMYYSHLKRFEKIFGHRSIKIFLMEDLKSRPEKLVVSLFGLLGVKKVIPNDLGETFNEAEYPVSIDVYKSIYGTWKKLRGIIPSSVVGRSSGLRGWVKGLFFEKKNSAARKLVKEEDRVRLAEIYSEPNRRLEEWLGRDLSHWK